MLSWLTDLIPPRPLGLTRIVVGAAALIRAFVAWPILTKLAQPETLRTPYTEWLPEPTTLLVVVILITWAVSAFLFMVGWHVPWSGSLLVAALVANLLLDHQTYSNHLYLMALLAFLLTLSRSGSGLSVSGIERDVVSWPVVLIMTQISIVYGFSAVTKINEDFLSGAVMAGVLRDGLIPFPSGLRTPAFLSSMAVIVIAVELFIALFLWSRRFRPYAFLLGLGLHVSIVALMADTGELTVFGLEMLATYPLFLGAEIAALMANRQWTERTERYNLIRLVSVEEVTTDDLTLTENDATWTGATAHTRTLERLVPWLWVAAVLRLPVVRQLHERRHQSRIVLPADSGH